MLKISADFENRLIYVTDDVTGEVTFLTQYKKFTKKTIQMVNFKGVGRIEHQTSYDTFSKYLNVDDVLNKIRNLQGKLYLIGKCSYTSHCDVYFEYKINQLYKKIQKNKTTFCIFRNKTIRKIVGTSLTNFINHLNKLMYKVFIAPIDEETKSKLLFGNGGDISHIRVAEYYNSKEHIDEAMNDGLPNVALLCMFFGKSRKETKQLFSKSQWKRVVNLPFSKLKKIVQATRRLKGFVTEKELVKGVVKLSGCATSVISRGLVEMDTSLIPIIYVSNNFKGMYKNISEIRRRAVIVSDTMRMCNRNNIAFNIDWSWNRMQQEHQNAVALENAHYMQQRALKDGIDFSKSFDYIGVLTEFISDDTVTDLKATIIKNGNSLMAHGQQMKHCVGSYYHDCYENRYVVYFVNHGEINSTLGIRYNPNKSEFRLDQHYGHCNSEVSDVVKNFGKKVVDKLNEEVKLDPVKQVFSKK